MGRIVIEGMEFLAPLGAYPQEREAGSRVEVSVELETDLSAAAQTDDLERAVNYEVIYVISEEVMCQKRNLLEQAARQILEKIASRFPEVKKIKVRVAKLHPPMGGAVRRVWVEETKGW